MSKKWGRREYWGLGSEFDLDWILTDSQKQLREELIEVCRKTIRPLAAENDKNYTFPRESLNALAELGLLGLMVPKELGGRGENYVCLCMVIETIARYGCPSTAMVYCMHISSTMTLSSRHHNNEVIRNLLSRLDKDTLVGASCVSDPTSGGHCWSQVACKSKFIDEDTLQILKYGSWCTSAGYADFYIALLNSPYFDENKFLKTHVLCYKDEVRANTSEWSALGLHSNMSGSIVLEGKINKNRIIGELEDSPKISSWISAVFYIMTPACWNGTAMGCMDVAKKHVTRKTHGDVGMRVCDYVTIQDNFGNCITQATASRMQSFMVAQVIDQATNNCDWSLYLNQDFEPMQKYKPFLWTNKCQSSSMVSHVADIMLQCCGGAGYKTDLGLEKLLRDAKAGWVMGPSNETLRNFLGKITLFDSTSADIFQENPNERVIHHELQKMSLKKKKELAKSLLEEVKANEGDRHSRHPFQDTDFENPFNTSPPSVNKKVLKTLDGVVHDRALRPDSWTSLTLKSSTEVGEEMGSFTFSLPKEANHTGCLPGQYVAIKVKIDGKEHSRYFSPVSRPDEFGKIELVLRHETQGIISQYFQSMKPGDKVDMQGPCGGFEYEANILDQVTFIASGGGITPALQMIRCIMNNPTDKTNVTLIYYSEDYDSILYRKELDQYSENQQLQVLYTLGSVPEEWDGEEGFISLEMLDKEIKKPNDLNHKIILCGGTSMVLSCLHSMKALGYPSHYMFIYGQFGIQLLKMVYGKNIKLSSHTCEMRYPIQHSGKKLYAVEADVQRELPTLLLGTA